MPLNGNDLQMDYDNKIPMWFYYTVISMGIMVFVAFGLILFGML